MSAMILLSSLLYFHFFNPDVSQINHQERLPPVKDAQNRLLEEAQSIDANYFTLTIHPEMIFPSSHEEGQFHIANVQSNVYPIAVSIQLAETTEEVYHSGAIYPGQEVRTGRLTVELAKGEYLAIAVVTLYDPETKDKTAITQAEVLLIIEN